jgi:hypothetical protein
MPSGSTRGIMFKQSPQARRRVRPKAPARFGPTRLLLRKRVAWYRFVKSKRRHALARGCKTIDRQPSPLLASRISYRRCNSMRMSDSSNPSARAMAASVIPAASAVRTASDRGMPRYSQLKANLTYRNTANDQKPKTVHPHNFQMIPTPTCGIGWQRDRGSHPEGPRDEFQGAIFWC